MKIFKKIIPLIMAVLVISITVIMSIPASAAVVIDDTICDLSNTPPSDFISSLASQYPSFDYDVDALVNVKKDQLHATSLVVTFNNEDTVYSGMGSLKYEPARKVLYFFIDNTAVISYTADSIGIRGYDSKSNGYFFYDPEEYSISASFQFSALPSDYVYDNNGDLVLRSSLDIVVLTAIISSSVPDLTTYLVNHGILRQIDDTDTDTDTDTEIFPDVKFNYLISDLDYELRQDNVSEFMNVYFDLQSVTLTPSTEVLATGNLTTNFGIGGKYMIILDRTYKFIYFQEVVTNRVVLKLDSSGYWYYKVYSNLGTAGEYKKLSDYGGNFWFSFESDDGTDIFPQVLVANEAVTVLDTENASDYQSGYLAGLKDGYDNGYDDGYGSGYDKGYSDALGKTFLGKFINELYIQMQDALNPVLTYELPFVGFSIKDVVKFCFSLTIVWFVAKIVGRFLK